MARLSYEIDVIGMRALDSAFAHIEARARKANRAMMLGAQQASAVVAGGGRPVPVAARASGVGRAARAAAMTQAQVKEEVAKRSEALKEKLAARTAARIAKIEASTAAKSEAEKAAIRQRAEAAQVRHAQRLARIEAASRSRMAAATAKEELRSKLRESSRSSRVLEQAEREKLGKLKAANALAVANRQRFGTTVGQAAFGAVTSVGKAAIGTAAIGGTALLGNALYTQSQESFRATQLANQAGAPERKGEILANAQKIEGFTGMEALNALGAWTDLTGDLTAGEGILKELGATALATGTNLDDLAAAAGNAFIPLNDSIADSEERMKALKTTIRAMAGMGAVGAVEIKDLASEMAGLAAQGTKFEGGPEQAMRVAIAMAQASRQRGGSSSAAEAVTSVERFGSDILTKQSDLRSMGVEVFTDKTHRKLRSQKDIMVDVLEKTHGDLGKIGSIFGERSLRAVQGFSPLYNQAEARKKGSGRAAVLGEFARLEKATLSDKAVEERTASIMESPQMQLKETMKEINAALGKELMPVALDLVKALKDATPEIIAIGKAAAGAAKWFVENPFTGMSVLISGAIVKEIVAARIGMALEKGITGASGGMDLKLAGATITIAAASLAIERMLTAQEKSDTAVVERDIQRQNVINQLTGTVRSGGALTDEQRREAEKQVLGIRSLKQEAAFRESVGASIPAALQPITGAGESFGNVIAGGVGDITDWLGITAGNGMEAQSTHRKEVGKAGKGQLDADLLRLTALLTAAGKDLKDGSAALKEAAKSGLNRGDKPSPVKG